jgi:FkbM family methyltransferase
LKFLKLSITALLTLLICLALFYVSDRTRFHWTFRCWQLAVTPSSCLKGGHFDFEANIDGSRYMGSTEDYLDRHILIYGAYEKPILFFLRDVMASAHSLRGVFLDIGANTGQHSLFMSKYAGEIHAFEPWHPVLKRFQQMVEINQIKNIVFHPYGLGDVNSKKPFFRPPDDNLATGSFVAHFRDSNTYDTELEIQIGDDSVKRAGLRSVDLIKMDIEGYERPALKGLRHTLHTYRPIVEFELSVDPKNSISIKNNNDLVALFPEEYEFLVFSEKNDPWTGKYYLRPLADVLQFERVQQYDVVAYPREKKKHIPLSGPRP